MDQTKQQATVTGSAFHVDEHPGYTAFKQIQAAAQGAIGKGATAGMVDLSAKLDYLIKLMEKVAGV